MPSINNQPTEVLDQVFEHFDQNTLFSLCLVSKQVSISATPLLYKRINVSTHVTRVGEIIESMVTRCHSDLRPLWNLLSTLDRYPELLDKVQVFEFRERHILGSANATAPPSASAPKLQNGRTIRDVLTDFSSWLSDCDWTRRLQGMDELIVSMAVEKNDFGALASMMVGAMRNLEELRLHMRHRNTHRYFSRILLRSFDYNRMLSLRKLFIEGSSARKYLTDFPLEELVHVVSLTEVRLQNMVIRNFHHMTSHLPSQWKLILDNCDIPWKNSETDGVRWPTSFRIKYRLPATTEEEESAIMDVELIRCKHYDLEQRFGRFDDGRSFFEFLPDSTVALHCEYHDYSYKLWDEQQWAAGRIFEGRCEHGAFPHLTSISVFISDPIHKERVTVKRRKEEIASILEPLSVSWQISCDCPVSSTQDMDIEMEDVGVCRRGRCCLQGTSADYAFTTSPPRRVAWQSPLRLFGKNC